MYTYQAYGLVFSSEFALPELKPAADAPDVTIRLSPVSPCPTADTGGVCRFQATSSRFILHVEGVAAYCVANGNEITLQPYTDIGAPDIRLFLLGSVFGALLQQRGYLVLHGACMVIDGKGILLTGRSGVGKSTLAAALNRRGHPLLTDDVCAVHLDNSGMPRAEPGFPSMKLWQDAAAQLSTSVDGLEPVMRNREKYRVGVRRYHDTAVTLRDVYQLNIHAQNSVEMVPVGGIARLDALIRNTYRYQYLKDQGVQTLHFRQCAAVAAKLGIYDVFRPKDGFQLDALADAIEQNVRGASR